MKSVVNGRLKAGFYSHSWKISASAWLKQVSDTSDVCFVYKMCRNEGKSSFEQLMEINKKIAL